MQTLHRTTYLLALLSLVLLPAVIHEASPPLVEPPPTHLSRLTPNLMVEDVNATVAFYRDVLGFDLVTSVPESGALDWALVRRDTVDVMFQSRASLAADLPQFRDRSPGGALTFYIDLEGIDALYAQVAGRGAVVKDLATTFYGTREFTMEDCNGFLLTFAEGGE